MASQQDIAAEMATMQAQLVKIGGETSTLITKIDELNAIIVSQPVTPELQAAWDAVKTQANVVDNLVPDAP